MIRDSHIHFQSGETNVFHPKKWASTAYARKCCFIVWGFFFWKKKKKIEANLFDNWWTEFLFPLLGAREWWKVRAPKLGLLELLRMRSTSKFIVHGYWSLFIPGCSGSRVSAVGTDLPLRLARHFWLYCYQIPWYKSRSMQVCTALTWVSTSRLKALETLESQRL